MKSKSWGLLLTVVSLETALLVQADDATIAGPARALKGDVVVIRGAKVRLFGIEAPEPQALCEGKITLWPCGAEAKAALGKRVDGKHLRCTVNHKIGHGSWQATCSLDGGDVGETQLRSGWARVAPDMSDVYGAAEAEARAARRGLWRNK